jgi:hypothetical protein
MTHLPISAEDFAKLNAVQMQYLDDLMSKPNVVGVGIGFARVADEATETPAIVVMVTQKLPKEALTEEELLPTELDGVRVDVQETGAFGAFSAQ